MRPARSGMSMIDALVILGILGLLMAILGHRLSLQLQERDLTSARLHVAHIHKAVQLYAAKNGALPPDLEAVRPYLSEGVTLTDGWGRPLRYHVLGSDAEVLSLGADGALGGEGADADISSLQPGDSWPDSTSPKTSP